MVTYQPFSWAATEIKHILYSAFIWSKLAKETPEQYGKYVQS